MKTIGLIGGLSWESTVEYYRIINETVRERLGGLHSAKIVMYSLDFSKIEALQRKGDWETLAGIMTDAAKRVERGGADLLVICANLMHRPADVVEANVQIPLLHIVDATASKIKEMGLKKIGLLGTRYTMEMDFYKNRLTEKHGIEVLIPEDEDRTSVHEIIYGELCRGIIIPTSKEIYLQVIERLITRGAEGIILGCTEIPLLIKQEDANIPLFNTTQIHAETAVEIALRETD